MTSEPVRPQRPTPPPLPSNLPSKRRRAPDSRPDATIPLNLEDLILEVG